MRMMAILFVALALSQACHAEYQAQIGEKSRKKWGVEIAIDSLEIHDPRITKDLIRAIYWHESEWRQFSPDGKAYSCREKNRRYRSWGVSQLYDDPKCRYPGIDYQRIKTDMNYNVRSGLSILEEKFSHIRHIRRKFHIIKSRSDIEVGLSLYNGWRKIDRWEYAKSVLEVMRKKPWESEE
jgi:hypothetical protein